MPVFLEFPAKHAHPHRLSGSEVVRFDFDLVPTHDARDNTVYVNEDVTTHVDIGASVPNAKLEAGHVVLAVAKIMSASRRRTAQAGFFALAAIALVDLAGSANAQGAWLQDGKVMKDQPNAVTSGSFAVMQIATDDPDRLASDWSKSSPGLL